MITISLSLIAAVALSFIAWCVLSLGIAIIFFFGDDDAFIKSYIFSTFVVLLYWLVYSGVITFK